MAPGIGTTKDEAEMTMITIEVEECRLAEMAATENIHDMAAAETTALLVLTEDGSAAVLYRVHEQREHALLMTMDEQQNEEEQIGQVETRHRRTEVLNENNRVLLLVVPRDAGRRLCSKWSIHEPSKRFESKYISWGIYTSSTVIKSQR